MAKLEVGFIGGGQMATALAAGAVSEGVFAVEKLGFVEPSSVQRAKLLEKFPGARVESNASDLCADCERIVLAVKPHILRAIAGDLKPLVGSQLVISIAAGISLADLQDMLGTKRVVRVMPNTPCLVGAGAAGFSTDVSVSDEDVSWVEKTITAVGTCNRVPDDLLHAVTGVSGSGPAYAYMVIEALSDGGVAMGLPRETATTLAAQTLLGAAEMVLQTGQHPGALKDQVTSPGGTTIAAVRSLESNGLRSSLMEAVAIAAKRSRELSS
ncbi:MAG: pyrroline-5-carboxylate reductase [Aureliella sp.]